MILTLSGFLFEERGRSQIRFESFVELAKRIGCTGVELRQTQVDLDTPREALEGYREVLKAAGLSVECMTMHSLPSTGPQREHFFERFLRLAAAMGSRRLRVSGEAEWLRSAATEAQRKGVELVAQVHIHQRTETVAGAKALWERVDHPNFGLLYDPLHLMVAGQDVLGAIDELFEAMRGVLVHSVREAHPGEKTWFSHQGRAYVAARMTDPGAPEWPAIFRRLQEREFDGWINIFENNWPAEQREGLASDMARYVRELWERAG